MKRQMFCPACKTPLVDNGPQVYETLCDHVECADYIPERPTVACSNPECFAHKDKCFWDAFDGEGPYSETSHKDDMWIDSNPNPFNSFSRQNFFQVYYNKEDWHYTIGKLGIIYKVRYESSEYGEKCGRFTSLKFTWNGVYYTSGIRMLIFDIKKFYKRRTLFKNEAKDIVKRSQWPRAEWWRKASALWIKIFHAKELA